MDEQQKPIDVVATLKYYREILAELSTGASGARGRSATPPAAMRKQNADLKEASDAIAEFIQAATPIARAFAANRSLSRELDDAGRDRFLRAFRSVGGRFGD